MSRWDGRIREHAVWAALKSLGPVIDAGLAIEDVEPEVIFGLERLKAILAYCGKRLAAADPQVTAPLALDTVATVLGAVQAEVNAFVQTQDPANIVNANISVDGALVAVAQIPGEYSQEELVALTNENLGALKDYNYFTYFHTANKKLEIGAPIRAGQTYNGKLHLHFEVPLKEPYDPRQGELTLKIYDPEFFIAFDYAKADPVGTEGDVAQGCKMIVKPVPTDAELTATQTMLATKGTDWKPENGEDYGSMFAQAVLVSCQK